MGGFAMQWSKTSRPASGAEHQFSHLWDMEHHTHNGAAPSHGFKVAIGTLAVAEMYQGLRGMALDQIDVDRVVETWPSPEAVEGTIRELLGEGELAEKARLEMAAKAVTPGVLGERLTKLKSVWPALRERLRAHLPAVEELRGMLAAVGAPTRPEEIGISRDRLRQSYRQAYLIRRRFTVLDLAAQAGVFEACLDRVFADSAR
jgi:glycerol-1-phosphate dehydrogenase [NAD(P)+]